MTIPYNIGDTIYLPAEFNIDGMPFTPSAISCKIKEPNGVIVDVSSSISQVTVGNYIAQFTADQIGTLSYEWIVTSGNISATRKKFLIVVDQGF